MSSTIWLGWLSLVLAYCCYLSMAQHTDALGLFQTHDGDCGLLPQPPSPLGLISVFSLITLTDSWTPIAGSRFVKNYDISSFLNDSSSHTATLVFVLQTRGLPGVFKEGILTCRLSRTRRASFSILLRSISKPAFTISRPRNMLLTTLYFPMGEDIMAVQNSTSFVVETACWVKGWCCQQSTQIKELWPDDALVTWLQRGRIVLGSMAEFLDYKDQAESWQRLDGLTLYEGIKEGVDGFLTVSATMAIAR